MTILAPNNVTPINGSFYKIIDSVISQEIFHLSGNVYHANAEKTIEVEKAIR